MLKEDDRAEFVEAISKEIEVHERRGHWIAVPRSSMPSSTKLIQSISAFRWKRLPGETLTKHKTRLCAHGGMQQ